MDVEEYFGQYVRIELDTGDVHQGVLEEVKDEDVTDYVRIKSGSELFLIPIEDIIKITAPHLH
jgi:hypothetical protein